MGKSVIFAVAGSGKTERLIQELTKGKRTLLITYTENNESELRSRIIKKFGHLPNHIRVDTYFSFLNRFCYRPLLLPKLKSHGITFDQPSAYSSRQALTDPNRYVTASGRAYHSRMAKALDVMGCIPELNIRLSRYFDQICVDEVQDFGGHDFNFLMQIVAADVDMLLVGDFHQHTYPTSRDGNVNANLHHDFSKYKKLLTKAGLQIEADALSTCHRCSTTVCNFIKGHFGININAATERITELVVIDDVERARALHADNSIVKLFLREHKAYQCLSMNWGESNGLNHFQDVCVVLTKNAWTAFKNGNFNSLAAITKNKLYVACSRANRNLYLVPDFLMNPFKSGLQGNEFR